MRASGVALDSWPTTGNTKGRTSSFWGSARGSHVRPLYRLRAAGLPWSHHSREVTQRVQAPRLQAACSRPL